MVWFLVFLYFFMGLVTSFFLLRKVVKEEGGIDGDDFLLFGVISTFGWPAFTPVFLFAKFDDGDRVLDFVEKIVSVEPFKGRKKR